MRIDERIASLCHSPIVRQHGIQQWAVRPDEIADAGQGVARAPRRHPSIGRGDHCRWITCDGRESDAGRFNEGTEDLVRRHSDRVPAAGQALGERHIRLRVAT